MRMDDEAFSVVQPSGALNRNSPAAFCAVFALQAQQITSAENKVIAHIDFVFMTMSRA
jgi:hypothetical protein